MPTAEVVARIIHTPSRGGGNTALENTMLLSATKWLAFLWGSLAGAVMCYYAVRWFPHATDIRYNEMAMGFAFGAFYGWPSWIALPAFAVAQRKELPRWQILLLVAPVLLAVALYIVGLLLARGVL